MAIRKKSAGNKCGTVTALNSNKAPKDQISTRAETAWLVTNCKCADQSRCDECTFNVQLIINNKLRDDMEKYAY